MNTNRFYYLVIFLIAIYIIPAKVILNVVFFGGLIITIIVALAVYKFRKSFQKFKNQNKYEDQDYNDENRDNLKKNKTKTKSLKDDDFDLSKDNIIDTDYEEL